MRLLFARIVMFVVIMSWSFNAAAGKPTLLEITSGETLFCGKLIALEKTYCWLMERDGRLHKIRMNAIDRLHKTNDTFGFYSAADLRDQLKREFQNTLEVAGSTHYLVCASPGKAQAYADMFEDVFRSLHQKFSPRGFKLAEVNVPLVAVVFPDRKQFTEYCQQDGVTSVSGMRGYYLRTSNRVALFDDRSPETGRRVSSFPMPTPCRKSLSHGSDVVATVAADLKETIIHEATHQVAFNLGLHSRIGANPKWVVEGLATMFEAPGIRERARRMPLKSKINRDRFVWFVNYRQSRRKPSSLHIFVASDRVFDTATLDSYSEAWALSLFLLETHASEYAAYLKVIANRDPFADYTSEDRLADFRDAFGQDLTRLELQFLRFMDRLAKSTSTTAGR
ncbi:MAG: DUF1570 domain-containing protein [Planctomycetota bacterium]|nr:DUF1570 domain-containing protein [Planctomycetota bacterium]